ncbi:ATP-binding protein [Photobacterium angustum]|uniref:ATP-binding protein n=1 Tax=Photobacterium angustum TaxID=661 RepID=UPI0005E2C041|nr:ATP-binding protein [Photobacterium angustum]KJG16854.1 hypothetical protein UA33_12600 [Photobacterium angustum]KJG23127.1 hypothetical protein UA39_11980 [Photobacterium angustum]KJG30160.1 hypothetical protein UA36_13000 [Photobacterium angustum]PSW96934.1 hypothetical protein C0W79_01400 [Photobacterium angustum]PSX00567.1 hypothetical protein C0W87_17490 [Photobacterium angustum]
MSRFKEIQNKLNEVSPIPVNMPKFYLLGDTGAGKTTIVRKILNTDYLKFPSVQQKRTTVAVTEYVLSRDLNYNATYIFKSKEQVFSLIREILDVAIEKAFMSKDDFDIDDLISDLEETPDERFRLKYILSESELESIAEEIKLYTLPDLSNRVEELKKEFDSSSDELETIVDMALDNLESKISIENKILDLICTKVSEMCDGFDLFSVADCYQHSENNKDDFIKQAKKLLSSSKNSISPVVEYARVQGDLLADWLPNNTELVLIDGEGIGHDTREASRLSARHLDYFHFSDSIGLVEESKKPFASGGKSAIEGVIRSGYLDKFHIIFSKLDEVEVNDDENCSREDKIKAVKKGFRNVKSALKENGVDANIDKNNLFYLSDVKSNKMNTESIQDITKLLSNITEKFNQDIPQFIEPVYDYEMLSSYLAKSSDVYIDKWNHLLNSKHWQTIKAFNRRMCWEMDEFRDMKPVADFHAEIIKELDFYISTPKGWIESATPSMEVKSTNRVKQEFSNLLLSLAREILLKKYNINWNHAMSLSGAGSTLIRKQKVLYVIKESLPDHKEEEAMILKNKIKELLLLSIEKCKA